MAKLYAYDEALRRIEKAKYLHAVDHIVGQSVTTQVNKHYEFKRVLAKGGEGIVIEALDTCLCKLRAVKLAFTHVNTKPNLVVHSNDDYKRHHHVPSSNEIRRWLRGARVQSELHALMAQHPRLGLVPDVLYCSTEPCWCVLEYVEGINSLDWCSDKKHQDVILFFYRLLQFVNKVHSWGFLHRDLKPSNILVTQGGLPVLIDFCLSKDLKNPDEITGQGVTLGSPIFLAPEGIEAQNLGYPSEVYALGAALWVYLVRRYPNNKEQGIWENENEPAPGRWPLRSVEPEAWREVIAKATAEDVSQRYLTLDEFIKDFVRVATSEQIELTEEFTQHLLTPVSQRVGTQVGGDVIIDDVVFDEFQFSERYPELHRLFYKCVKHVLDHELKKKFID